MGLTNALQIGQSGLQVNQIGLEVTGNNLANASTPGFHRSTVSIGSRREYEVQSGIFIGRGAQIESINRQIDEALETRIRGGVSDRASAGADVETLRQLESIFNELSDTDISSELSEFFSAFNNVANNPEQDSLKQTLVQQAGVLTSRLRSTNQEVTALREQVDSQIEQDARALDSLLTQYAEVDRLVISNVRRTNNGNSSGGILDQRDALLSEISEFIDISPVPQSNGAVDLYIGGVGIVQGSDSRGVELSRLTTPDGELQVELVTRDRNVRIDADSGRLGALVRGRDANIDNAVDTLDDFSAALIYEVNRLHSQGQSTTGFNSVTGTYNVQDATAALNSNEADLAFAPVNGSFEVVVRQRSTGAITRSRVSVDLDDVDTANNTSLTSLAGSIDNVANVSSAVTPDGRLNITTDADDFEIFFGEDTSGALASLGVNTFFEGQGAFDIKVKAGITPDKIADGRNLGLPDFTSNGTALELAELRNASLASQDGLSLTEIYNRNVEDYGVRLGDANQRLEANGIVLDNLNAQQQAVSGVNIDEETINLLQYQRSYQANARLISVVDELFDTLLSLV